MAPAAVGSRVLHRRSREPPRLGRGTGAACRRQQPPRLLCVLAGLPALRPQIKAPQLPPGGSSTAAGGFHAASPRHGEMFLAPSARREAEVKPSVLPDPRRCQKRCWACGATGPFLPDGFFFFFFF